MKKIFLTLITLLFFLGSFSQTVILEGKNYSSGNSLRPNGVVTYSPATAGIIVDTENDFFTGTIFDDPSVSICTPADFYDIYDAELPFCIEKNRVGWYVSDDVHFGVVCANNMIYPILHSDPQYYYFYPIGYVYQPLNYRHYILTAVVYANKDKEITKIQSFSSITGMQQYLEIYLSR